MQTVGALIWYWGSSIILSVLLYFPARKIIWASRIRKMERKLQRATTEEERAKIKKSSNIMAAIIVVTFSFLFNKVMFQS